MNNKTTTMRIKTKTTTTISQLLMTWIEPQFKVGCLGPMIIATTTTTATTISTVATTTTTTTIKV